MSNTKPSAVIQTIKLTANTKQIEKIAVQPGQSLQIIVDGQLYTGQKTIDGRRLRLARQSDKLILATEDAEQPLLEISGFFAHDPASAQTTDFFSPADMLLGAVDPQTLFETSHSVQWASASGHTPFDIRGVLVAQAAPTTSGLGSKTADVAPANEKPSSAGWGTLLLGGLGLAAMAGGGGKDSASPSPSPTDTTPPTATVTDNVAGTATGPITYTIRFSEAVHGFDASKISASTGTLSGFSASADGKSFTIVLTPPAHASGHAQLRVSTIGVADAAGNAAVAPGVQEQAFNTRTLTVSDNVTGTASGPVTFTITFSEPVHGFGLSHLSLSSGNLSGFTAAADGKTFTVLATPDLTTTGTLQLSVGTSGVTDASGNLVALPTVAEQVFAQNVLQGTIYGGPVVSTHSLSIKVFNAASQAIASGTVDANGHYKVALGNFTGPVSVLVIDHDDAKADHMDEVKMRPVDLTAHLLAVGNIIDSVNIQTININPITTVAAHKAGVQATSDGLAVQPIPWSGPEFATRITQMNIAVAKALNIGSTESSLISSFIVPTVTPSGQDNMHNANTYGKVLAILSGVDQIKGADTAATIRALVQAITEQGLVSTTIHTLLAQAAALANVPVTVVLPGYQVPDPDPETINFNTASAKIAAYAQDNGSSNPAPVAGDYAALAVTGIGGAGQPTVAMVNSALATAAIANTNADTAAEVQAIVNAYAVILSEANDTNANAGNGVADVTSADPLASDYAAIGAVIGAAASDAENLALLNDIVGASQASDVASVAQINDLARIANAVQQVAAGGTPSPALSVADLGKAGLTGVTDDSLAAVLQALAAAADDGTATDTVGELQGLIDGVTGASGTYTLALAKIAAYAQDNGSSNPAPVAGDYAALAVTGIGGAGQPTVAMVNSALATAAVANTHADTAAEVQAIVNAYAVILNNANAADATAAGGIADATAAQYAAIGVSGVDAGVETQLLGSVIDAKAGSDVDTVAKVQALAGAVQAVMDGTATQAQLELLGITGASADNLGAVQAKLVATADADLDSVSELQAAVTAAVAAFNAASAKIAAYAQDNGSSNPAPVAGDYAALAVTGIGGAGQPTVAMVNSALATAAVANTNADTAAEVQAIVNAYAVILNNANAADATAAGGIADATAAQYASIGVSGVDAGVETQLLGSVIDAKAGSDVDTVAKVQALAHVVNKIMLHASGTSQTISEAEFELIGIDSTTLTAARASALLTSIGLVSSPSDVNTLLKLSNLIDTIAPTLSGTVEPTTALTTLTGGAGNSTGETITLTLTFDGNVDGLTSGSTSSVFTVGGTGVSATWGGVSGSNTRTLTYTIASGQSGQAAIDEVALKAALVAGITDAAGNAFTYTNNGGLIPNIDSTPLPVIDTTVIVPTVISAVLSADTSPTGNNNDFLTKTASQTISGTLSTSLSSGQTVRVSLDSGLTWGDATGTVGSTAWSLPSATLLSGSGHLLRAKVVDVSGVSSTDYSQAYTLDTTGPGSSVLGMNSHGFLESGRYYALNAFAKPAANALASNFTLETWVKATSNVNQGERIFDFSAEAGTFKSNIILQYDNAGNDFRFVAYNAAGTAQLVNFAAAGAVVRNTWQHVAVTVNGTTATLYVDGVSRATGTLSAPITAATRDASYLGRSNFNPTTDGQFDGEMFDMRIYHDARTAAEVLADTRNPPDLSDPNLTTAFISIGSALGTVGGSLQSLGGTGLPTSTNFGSVRFSDDSGASPLDFVTQTATQTLKGVLSANLGTDEAVYVSLNNGSTWTQATVSGRNWTLANQTLPSGTSTMLVKVADLADNGTVRSRSYTYEVPVPSFTPDLVNNGTFTGSGFAWGFTPGVAYDNSVQGAVFGAAGTGNGTLSQTVTVYAGQSYTLTFDARLWTPSAGPHALVVSLNGTQLMSTTVTSNALANYTVTFCPTVSGNVNLNFFSPTQLPSQDMVVDNVALRPDYTGTNAGSVRVTAPEASTTAYLVSSAATVSTVANINALADNQFNSVSIAQANTVFDLPLTGLAVGTYKLYLADAAGNLSAPNAQLYTVAATATPLVLDLNGDGVRTVAVADGVLFDVDANGQPQRTGWTDGKDGLLVRDLNHDGLINDGRELFGSGTATATGQAADGYEALRPFDANADGVIDAQDAVFSQLQLWVDANRDGVTDAGELHSLAAYGVTALSLQAQTGWLQDQGNTLGLVSSWTDSAGQTHALADVWFVNQSLEQLVSQATGGLQRDLTLDTGANTLDVRLDDLLAAAQKLLVVKADANDEVRLDATGWVNTGTTTTVHNHTYGLWSQGGTHLLIDELATVRAVL